MNLVSCSFQCLFCLTILVLNLCVCNNRAQYLCGLCRDLFSCRLYSFILIQFKISTIQVKTSCGFQCTCLNTSQSKFSCPTITACSSSGWKNSTTSLSHTLKNPLLNSSNTRSTDLLKAQLTKASTNSFLLRKRIAYYTSCFNQVHRLFHCNEQYHSISFLLSLFLNVHHVIQE